MDKELKVIIFATLSKLILELQKSNDKPDFNEDEVYIVSVIFKLMIADKMSELCVSEDMEEENVINMAENCNKELSKYIKTYTGIDLSEYQEKKKNEYKEFLKIKNN